MRQIHPPVQRVTSHFPCGKEAELPVEHPPYLAQRSEVKVYVGVNFSPLAVPSWMLQGEIYKIFKNCFNTISC